MKLIAFLFLLGFLNLYKEKSYYSASKSNSKDSIFVQKLIQKMKILGPNKMDSVKLLAFEGLAYLDDKEYPKGEFLVCYAYASELCSHGELTEAISYAQKALILAKTSKDLKQYGDINGLLGTIYGKKGDFVKSTKYVYNALKNYEKIKNQDGILSSYIKLSAISVQTGKFDDVITYTSYADSLNKIIKNKKLEIDILNNRAIAYAEKGDLDKALKIFEYLKRTINEDEIGFIGSKILATMNMGLVYVQMKDYNRAISYYKESFNASIKYNFPEGIIKNTQNLSVAYHLQGNYDLSNKEGLKALEKAKAMKVLDLEITILEHLKQNYLKQKDYKNALLYSDQYHEAIAKNDVKNRESEVSHIKDQYELEKAQEQLKLVREINDTRTKQRNLSNIFLLIVFVFMVIFAYAYYRIRSLNRQNVNTRNKLKESNQIKDKLFSIIGHDLRSAYSTTLGVLFMIKDKELDKDEQHFLVNKVINQSQHALETLDNLLMWGYSQIKGSKLKIIHFNCYYAVEKNIKFLEENILSKNILIKNEVPETLAISMDENHFNFVVRNLISNAVKFTGIKGEITVGYNDKNTEFHQFYVKDNGVGISVSRLNKMFTAAGNSTEGTKKEKGTGLGLLLCKEFVELNGGKISAESKEDEGTTIFFTVKKEPAN
jgi:signal transduction histidine kinase